MPQDILINWSPQETRVAMVEGGAVQELHIERALERGLVGNIYLGKVARVLPGMQSAFIDIGLERAAFLHVADLMPPGGVSARFDGSASGAQTPVQVPIERQVYEGQALVVQVVKDPIGSKGARLSTQVSIAGRMLVFLPQDNHIGISQKIESIELREQLRVRMATLVGEGGGGYILRTNAEDATDGELVDDIAYLRKAWHVIRDQSLKVPPCTLLHQDLTLAQRVLRDLTIEQTQTIRIDSQLQFEQLRAFGEAFTPGALRKLELYRGERPLFDLYNVEQEIQRALARRVDLKSGGYLIVDQTEALTTVDVNTGGFVGTRNFDDTIFKNNLEAAIAIARQLRLRNLGGIIIVDVIDMTRDDHRTAVLAVQKTTRARSHQAHRQRLHAIGAGGDDAQAHARVAGTRAVRTVPHLRRPRSGENGAQRLLRHPARDRARSAPVRPQGVSSRGQRRRGRDAARRRKPAPGGLVAVHRQADLAGGGAYLDA